jgi:threonine dehydrogenase-like Zn-dependent dehydrogenase
MAEQFLAAVAVDDRRTEVQEFTLPEIGPDEGLLQIQAAGVCGSDWPNYIGETPISGQARIIGHENVGYIAKVGAEAAKRWDVKEGDRVAVEEFIPCGHCKMCRSGNYRVCDATDLTMESRPGFVPLRYGSTPLNVAPALWGGFSKYMYMHPNSIVYKIAEHVDPEQAPLFIPISNGIRWVNQDGEAGVGSTVVILGPGQHGLGCVIGAREAGASRIIVTGLSTDTVRLDLARELGAHDIILADKEDTVERVREITGGAMADLAIEITAGAAQPVLDAMDVVRKRGVVVLAGSKHGRPIPGFISDRIIRKELTVKGVRGHDFRSVEPAIEIIESGKYPLQQFCTHRFGLEDVDLALRTIGGEGEPNSIHITVLPE